MIVVDTNIIANLVIQSEFSGLAGNVLKRDPIWVCPSHWQSELSSILTLYIKKGILTFSTAQELLVFARDLIGNGSMAIPYRTVLRLAAQSACCCHDCEFVALAQAIGVTLVTNDKLILKEFPDTAISLADFVAN